MLTVVISGWCDFSSLLSGLLKLLAYTRHCGPQWRLSPGQGPNRTCCPLQAGWLPGVWELPVNSPPEEEHALPADCETAVATAPPPSAVSVPSPEGTGSHLQCAAGRGAGTSWGLSGVRSVLSPTLGGTLLFEEVRLRSHVGRTGEGCQNPGKSEPVSPQ